MKLIQTSVGQVKLYRYRRSKHIRIKAGSPPKVSAPLYVPEFQIRKFVESQADFLTAHQIRTHQLVDGMQIGKYLHLVFTDTDRASTVGNQLRIPNSYSSEKQRQVVRRSLKIQSQNLILARVEQLATKHGLTYRNCQFKRLSSRWGSCTNHADLVFNIYLVQLPWELIDYVILHELAHITHHNHSQKFWQLVHAYDHNYLEHRRQLKKYHPQIIGGHA